jgi:menaquinone-dependent protoporphyrinogen oxidase
MKVLVTAASRHGATTEVAASIGAVLAAAGHDVQVLHPSDVRRVDNFDAAVIGSAVYMGRWMEPTRDLVQREKVALTRVPVWLFSCGPIGNPPMPADESIDGAALVELVRAREHVTFAGRIERRSLGFGEKAIMAAVRAPEGDFRDWAAIEGWARGIAAALVESGVPA